MIQYIKTTFWSKRAGWLRWVISPLCVAGMLAFGVANSAPSDAEHVKPGPAVAHAASGVPDVGEVQELKARFKELEDATRQNYALELEGQRKKLDWWLTFIGVLAAIMAIAGGFIPYLMGRKDKEIIELDRKAIDQDKEQIKRLLDEMRGMKEDAEDSVEEIHRHEAEAKAAKETVLDFQSGTPPASDEKVREAVEKIEQDKTADFPLRLRAEAVAASQAENESRAYALWAALAEIAADDASAQFNAGYWAHQLGRRVQGNEKLRWLRQAGNHYSKAIAIKSDMHESIHNWGSALADEAQELEEINPEAARELRKQANEKYWQVLAIKPDYHIAANNCGNYFLQEARVIASSNPEESKRLVEQAKNLLLNHAEAAPGVVAYNLACVYGLRGDVQSCLKWLKVRQERGKPLDCEYMRNDQDLDPVRNDPDFIAWLEQACPTQAAATQDNKA